MLYFPLTNWYAHMPALVILVTVHSPAGLPFTFHIFSFIHLQDTGNVIFIRSVESDNKAGTCNDEFIFPGLNDNAARLRPGSILCSR